MKEYRLTDWLPTTKKEIELRGWDSVDVILFSADAYVDHPSFGAAVIGRTLEAAGYTVAIVPQPDWHGDFRDFKKLGPKFGKQMKAVAAAVAEMSQEAIAELEKNGRYTFVLDGAEAVVEAADVEIFSEDIPGWLVANEGTLTVALEVTVTEELKREGIARELVNRIQQDKLQMEQLKYEAERAEREGNYERVAEIRYSKLRMLEDDIKNIQNQLKGAQGDNAMIREEVTADDIAEVVSRWTGIPVTRMMQSEREKLLHLEEELHKRVIGQEEAITAVSDAVRRSRAGLQDPKRPIASFIFLGTTGVGKTELAKALAEYLFNDETMMTRIDMSEYQEKFSVSRLIGAPPGYVGYDEGGQLTEAVRRKPYSVVLFDEIEKAHPDVFNILLQVLDDGRLTDNKGRTVNFKNTIIIMTSNLGSQLIREELESHGGKLTDSELAQLNNKLMSLLKKTIRPEFLNRIDDTIMFLPLTKEQIAGVVRLQMDAVRKMLEPQGFTLKYTDAAINWLADAGYDPEFGARPVKRAIQDYVLNDLSKKLLAEEVSREKPVIIDANGAGLVFRN